MDILYMGYFCNEKVFNKLVEAGSHSSHARQQLETKLLSGMMAERGTDSLALISYLPEIAEVHRDTGDGEVYGDIDINYLWCNKKNLFSVIAAIRKNILFIKEWAKGKKEKAVLTYSVNPIHALPLYWLKKRYNIKVITLCSEVSTFRRQDNISFASRISRKISSLLDNSFDGYVLLTPFMNEIVNRKNKPYLVMEGIASKAENIAVAERHKAILYAGGLTEDNGLKILLEGFVKLNRSDIELWICGEGPLEAVVREYADNQENIRFYGIIPNEKVQIMEREAMLLISPRLSNNDFTKYSFPSKTIEYMSTGIPTVLTRLAGIPNEYFNYVYVLEEETAKGVEQLISRILEQSPEEREKVGREAQNFVLQRKNPSTQARKVIQFMKQIIENE